jgi:hypothetical protein
VVEIKNLDFSSLATGQDFGNNFLDSKGQPKYREDFLKKRVDIFPQYISQLFAQKVDTSHPKETLYLAYITLDNIDKERHSFVDCELTTSHFMTLSTFVNNLDGWQS